MNTKTTLTITLALALGLAGAAFAGPGHDHGPKAKAAASEKAAPKATGAMTLKGEILDTGCYMGHEARGEKHKSCATKCIAGGMPMTLITADGMLYLLTPSHDNADAYNQCKDWAAMTVEVTGTVNERGGMRAIEVASAKPAQAAAAPKSSK